MKQLIQTELIENGSFLDDGAVVSLTYRVKYGFFMRVFFDKKDHEFTATYTAIHGRGVFRLPNYDKVNNDTYFLVHDLISKHKVSEQKVINYE